MACEILRMCKKNLEPVGSIKKKEKENNQSRILEYEPYFLEYKASKEKNREEPSRNGKCHGMIFTD